MSDTGSKRGSVSGSERPRHYYYGRFKNGGLIAGPIKTMSDDNDPGGFWKMITNGYILLLGAAGVLYSIYWLAIRIPVGQ